MEYHVIYSDRKTISLSIKEEKLLVRAPYGTSNKRIEQIISDHLDWIEKNIDKQQQRNEKYKNLTEADISNLRKKAKTVLTQKTSYYANIMGLKYGRITITGATTRFGSCSGKGNISYSYRLMLYPEEAIDYVVVHELAHLAEMNHSAKFYKIVESILPDYKKRQKMLKK
jgi:predicted metal-dependent hydrolase